jgi:putative phosphoribosyl transferase
MPDQQNQEKNEVKIPIDSLEMVGNLIIPDEATGVVLFAHGSGSSRFSPRNRHVAAQLQKGKLATFLLDLLTPEEDEIDRKTRKLRFDIDLLAERVSAATEWLADNPETGDLPIGYFGASTGAAAAIMAAADRPDDVAAVVSRGGRPDLAEDALAYLEAPILLLVGEKDREVIEMNQNAYDILETEKKLVIIPGASHLFEEKGALDKVADLAGKWFQRYLPSFYDEYFE